MSAQEATPEPHAGDGARELAHHLAGIKGRHLVAVLVDQADVAGGGGAAHGVQLGGVQVGVEDAGAAALVMP